MPSGSNTRSRRNTSSGCPAARAIEHAEHVGAGVVQPALARLVQQRQGAEPAHPLVGLGRHLRLRRAGAQAELAHRLEQRLRPRRLEVHAEPEPEREHVVQRDRPVGGDGVAVDRAPRVDEHPPVGELGQQVVDGIVEPQPALLDEDQRADGDDRLGHRRDAEDRVAADRLAPRRGSARRRHPTSTSSSRAASQATPPTVSRSTWPAMTSPQPLEPVGIESTHARY